MKITVEQLNKIALTYLIECTEEEILKRDLELTNLIHESHFDHIVELMMKAGLCGHAVLAVGIQVGFMLKQAEENEQSGTKCDNSAPIEASKDQRN